jgi:hypothetical protein
MNRKPSKPARAAATPEPLDPVGEVLAALAKIKIEAQAGNVRAVAIAFVTADKPFIGSTSGSAPGDMLSVQLLVAAIDDMRHEFQHAKRGH